MNKKPLRHLSLIFFILGVIVILSSKIDITGALIGVSIIPSASATLFGFIFIVISILLYLSGFSLEDRLKSKNIVLQRRRNGFHLYNNKTGESYSIADIKELSKDNEMRRELRNEYFSDLLRLYAESRTDDKEKYRSFIKAFSPHANDANLNKRLKQFENVYERLKDKIEYMNPKRIDKSNPHDFGSRIYARFENEGETFWPDEGFIGFLPFDEIKVNPRRGPLFSIIPLNKLVTDGYLIPESLALNGAWSKDKRKNYLRNTFGIDNGPGQRTLILFNIEKFAELTPFGNYENVVIKDKIPLVRVLKKK